eukprot:12151937-Ditylum_brightwellii.AAC.1
MVLYIFGAAQHVAAAVNMRDGLVIWLPWLDLGQHRGLLLFLFRGLLGIATNVTGQGQPLALPSAR